MKTQDIPEPVINSIHKIVCTYYFDEAKHYDECEDKPIDHIFHDIELVGRWVESLEKDDPSLC